MQTLSNVDQLFGRPLVSGDVVAVVTLYSGGPTWKSCVESLLIHTPAHIPLIIFEDAGPSDAALKECEEVEEALGKQAWIHKSANNLGVVGNLNSAFSLLDPADVIVLNSDIIVGSEWAERLVAAARSRTDISTATALSSNGTVFTVSPPEEWLTKIPSITDVDRVAKRVASRSAQIRPISLVATSFCTYFARKALNIVGALNMLFSPGYGEEVDFSLRCVSFGFTNVAADDVYVFHSSGESFGDTEINPRKAKNDALLEKMYPFYREWIHDFVNDPLTSLNTIKGLTHSVIHGLRIVMDAELVHPNFTGTYTGSLALTESLLANPEVQELSWAASSTRIDSLRTIGRSFASSKFAILSVSELSKGRQQFDIALKPAQDYGSSTWSSIRLSARRNVVWHLDTISSQNPFYHDSFGDLMRTNWAVRDSWYCADSIAVLTEHVRQCIAASWDLAGDAQRLVVIPNGSPSKFQDLVNLGPNQTEIRSGNYLLVLGTSYKHKNRVWAMNLLKELSTKGYTGNIIFVGPSPSTGSSEDEEHSWLELNPSYRHRIGDRNWVSENDKRILIMESDLVLVPSVTEGFGLIPIEVARFGVAPMSSDGGGLRDVVPADVIALDFNSLSNSAESVLNLLNDKYARQRQIDLWNTRGDSLTWNNTAELFVDTFFSAISRQSRLQLLWKYSNPTLRRTRLTRSLYLLFVRFALFVLGTDTKRRMLASKIVKKMKA